MLEGLSSNEAKARFEEFGANQITKTRNYSSVKLLVSQFKSPLIFILLFACALSIGLGEWGEASAVFAILAANALIGFYQEHRAEGAMKALMQLTAPRARVIRNDEQVDLLASKVVPGDLLLLEAGDVVAADGRIEESARLQLNEAVLTGESVSKNKQAGIYSDVELPLGDRKHSVFAGTAVAAGTAKISVTATGMRTELGKIAQLMSSVKKTETPLQGQLSRVGLNLLWICLAVVTLVFGLGFYRGQPWLELFIFASSLAVAAVPEGLPAIVTVALALGVRRMAAQQVLIRRISSLETLGSVSVICTDKTGTLTTGKMQVRSLWGASDKDILLTAASCCDSELSSDHTAELGDTTELAILVAARTLGINKSEIERANVRTKTEPFNAEKMLMSVARADGCVYVKGAFESVVRNCERGFDFSEAKQKVAELALKGLRVLAVAKGNTQKESFLKFVGVIGFADPPREGVKQAIADAQAAGIKVVMITGDYLPTASAIARELGILKENESPDGIIHARATPQEKLKLVNEWKTKGSIVAMTGDGVNDAPALRAAHIGIAMGIAGTQVTRESADLVLADDNFATIIIAVREGRGIYQNIRKSIVFLLAGNFGELTVVLGASILHLPSPFLASHLLWINLVTDAFPALALIADRAPRDVMSYPPRSSRERILEGPQWIRIVVVGTIESISVGALFWIELNRRGLEHARNLTFTTLVLSQLLRLMSARSKSRTILEVGVFTNRWIVITVAGSIALQLSLHFIPLTQAIFGLSPITARNLFTIVCFAAIPVVCLELDKLITRLKSASFALMR